LDIPNPKRTPNESELKGTVLSKANKEELAIKRMMRLTKCEDSEAKFYLSEADYDVNKAMEIRRDDLNWESEFSKEKKGAKEAEKSGIAGRFSRYMK